MVSYDFTVKKKTGVDTIKLGNSEKTVTIDVTFVPSAIGFRLKDMLATKGDKDQSKYSPEALAEIIAMFTDEVDAKWIADNADYGTLDQIVAIIINKALVRRPAEKN